MVMPHDHVRQILKPAATDLEQAQFNTRLVARSGPFQTCRSTSLPQVVRIIPYAVQDGMLSGSSSVRFLLSESGRPTCSPSHHLAGWTQSACATAGPSVRPRRGAPPLSSPWGLTCLPRGHRCMPPSRQSPPTPDQRRQTLHAQQLCTLQWQNLHKGRCANPVREHGVYMLLRT